MLGVNAAILLHAFAIKRPLVLENILFETKQRGKVLSTKIPLPFKTHNSVEKSSLHVPEASLYKNTTLVILTGEFSANKTLNKKDQFKKLVPACPQISTLSYF